MLQGAKRRPASARFVYYLKDKKEAVATGETHGLRSEENAANSWEQAAFTHKVNVATIVEESELPAPKDRDVAFDLASTTDCLQSPTGPSPRTVDKMERLR